MAQIWYWFSNKRIFSPYPGRWQKFLSFPGSVGRVSLLSFHSGGLPLMSIIFMQGFPFCLPASGSLLANCLICMNINAPAPGPQDLNLGLMYPEQLQSKLVHFPFELSVFYLFLIPGDFPFFFFHTLVWIFCLIVMLLFSISVCLKYGRGTMPNHVAISLISTLLWPDNIALYSSPTIGLNRQ